MIETTADQSAQADFDTQAELAKLIEFHNGWKRFSSYASFAGAALSIVAAATASVVAGLGNAPAAAIIAALATIFTSLEKVLQFRERWDLHRDTEERLDQLRWEVSVGQLPPADLLAQIGQIRTGYSEKMSAFRVRA